MRLQFGLLALFLAVTRTFSAQAAEPVAGWIEEVRLYPGAVVLTGKLDSGADISSLAVRSLRHFKRDGEAWVAFSLTDARSAGSTLERPLVRTARIRRLGGVELRPVVALGLCVAGVYASTEVSLADREGFEYPLLVGRAFLARRLLIDAARERTAPPDCPAALRE